MKKYSVIVLLLLAGSGLVLGIVGANSMMSMDFSDPDQLKLPLATQISGKLQWVTLAGLAGHIFCFKVKKTNLLWCLLSYLGVIIYGIKVLREGEVSQAD